jgi:uncharacterized DUF497 family protein
MRIDWDPQKARSNVGKHGVHFSDVEIVFSDPFAVVACDPDAEDEERFVVLGADATGRVVVAVYTYRGDTLRLISARPATKRERLCYEEGIRL